MDRRLKSLLEAIELLHDHECGPFHERLFAAALLVFPETSHSLDLWRKQNGVYETAQNVPYDQKSRSEILQRVGELVPVEHPCFAHVTSGSPLPVQIADFLSLREFKRRELYQAAFKPVEVTHQLALPLVTETHAGGLTINRGGQRIFSPEEMQVAAILARHVALAHHAAEVLAAAREQRPQASREDHLNLRRAGLTRRQSEVLHWIGQGKRDQEIAIILGISYRTVTEHVRGILSKLGVETRTAAAVFADRRRKG